MKKTFEAPKEPLGNVKVYIGFKTAQGRQIYYNPVTIGEQEFKFWFDVPSYDIDSDGWWEGDSDLYVIDQHGNVYKGSIGECGDGEDNLSINFASDLEWDGIDKDPKYLKIKKESEAAVKSKKNIHYVD